VVIGAVKTFSAEDYHAYLDPIVSVAMLDHW
jgi:hypothetical protein